MLEKDIVAAIQRYLATLGEDVFFWKEHGGALGTSGIPDIICCWLVYTSNSSISSRIVVHSSFPFISSR